MVEKLLLPGKTMIHWIHMRDALYYCCCFSSGVNRPTRKSSPRPNYDDKGLSGNSRKATHYSPYMGPLQSAFDPDSSTVHHLQILQVESTSHLGNYDVTTKFE